MAIIERDDGVKFISPSYRELISAKKKSLLKKEIQMLSANYGSFAFIRKKNASQYEVAFNSEGGYLLGETVLKYFDNLSDIIFCERRHDSKEAILVIIKAGSVYVDTQISVDTLGEELIALRSQKNKYHIYIYGDIPISEKPSTTKFFFDAQSVASFNVLQESIFETLQTYEAIKLQPLKKALAAASMGAIPLRPLITGIIVILVLYYGFDYIKAHKKSLPRVLVGVVDPYARFSATLSSPDPSVELYYFTQNIETLYSMPGASVINATFSTDKGFYAQINPNNIDLSALNNWSIVHRFKLSVDGTGVHLAKDDTTPNRHAPKTIYKLKGALILLIDNLKMILPENDDITLGTVTNYGQFSEMPVTLNLANFTPSMMYTLANIFKNMPMNLTNANITISNGLISGTINLTIMGN